MKPNGMFVTYSESKNCIYFNGELRDDRKNIPKEQLAYAIAGSQGFKDYQMERHGVFVRGLIITGKESMYLEEFQDLIYGFAEDELIKTVKSGASTKACLAAENALAGLCERLIEFIGDSYE